MMGETFCFFPQTFSPSDKVEEAILLSFLFFLYPEGFLLLLLMGPWYRRERERKKVDPARVASRVLQLRQKLEGG